MKTAILTIAIALSTVIGISKSASAATGSKEAVSTVLTDVSKISQIEVRGNVELYLSDGSADQVKVYNSYYAENALVQDNNGVLRITSYDSKKLVVWVTASDLRNLSVYDDAKVKSFGKLSSIDIDIKLYNSASAQINMDTYAAAITLHDKAKADIEGNISEATLTYDMSSSLNITKLSVSHIVKSVKFNTAIERDELAELASL
jgi:hypothetical protein